MNKSGYWMFDQFRGFSVTNSSWDIAGNYIARGALYYDENDDYELKFTIYVEGKYTLLDELRKYVYYTAQFDLSTVGIS